MTYSIILVTGEFSNSSIAASFPATFRYALQSCWFVLGTGGGVEQSTSAGSFPFPWTAGWDVTANPTVAPGQLFITTQDGVVRFPNYAGQAIFDSSSLLAGTVYNLLVSIDSIAQIAQVYVNDQALPQISANWQTSAAMIQPDSTFGPAITLGATESFGGVPPCVADAYWDTPVSFFDLSVTANRRKFINADLTPVDLGIDGSGPLGTPPLIYLTVRPGDGAAAFDTNRTPTGGVFTNAVGDAFCALLPRAPDSLACGADTTTSITPTWSPVGPTPDSYTLQYRAVGASSWIQIAGIASTSQEITGLAFGAQYEWQVEAIIGALNTGFSASMVCSTMPPYPDVMEAPLCGWRGQCGVNWLGLALVEDKYSPVVGLSDFENFTEYGNQMRMLITTPNLHGDRHRIFVPRFEIDVQAGDGMPLDPTVGPVMMLDYSRDGGQTFVGLSKWRSMGAQGQYKQRLRWLNLGQGRQWMFRIQCTDPVRRQIIGAYIDSYEGLG